MARRFGALGILIVCILAISLTISCQKLGQPAAKGPLTYQSSRFDAAIPDDYGNLVGVTQNGQAPAWVVLWFQKPDHTITAVFVNLEEGRIHDQTLTIPRK